MVVGKSLAVKTIGERVPIVGTKPITLTVNVVEFILLHCLHELIFVLGQHLAKRQTHLGVAHL